MARPVVGGSLGVAAVLEGGQFCVDHEPYGVAPVDLHHADRSLLSLNGIDPPIGPAEIALWSPGVEVSVYPLQRLPAAG